MTNNTIVVGMADLNVGKAPSVITTLGLGSCVGIVLYDNTTKTGGMAHVMLPDSKKIKNNSNRAKFVDTAVLELIAKMRLLGASLPNLKAKLAGGAQMFAMSTTNENMKIGERNIEASLIILKALNIPIVARDVGKNFGRTIELHTKDGSLVIKTIGHGTKTL